VTRVVTTSNDSGSAFVATLASGSWLLRHCVFPRTIRVFFGWSEKKKEVER